jgi:ATP-dependent DNA ligase
MGDGLADHGENSLRVRNGMPLLGEGQRRAENWRLSGDESYTFRVSLPLLQPLPLSRRPEPFSHPDWLFEVKYEGFRALAYLDPSGVRLISRNGKRFGSFTDLCTGLEFCLNAKNAILDGEIVCLDENGCSQFNNLHRVHNSM